MDNRLDRNPKLMFHNIGLSCMIIDKVTDSDYVFLNIFEVLVSEVLSCKTSVVSQINPQKQIPQFELKIQ